MPERLSKRFVRTPKFPQGKTSTIFSSHRIMLDDHLAIRGMLRRTLSCVLTLRRPFRAGSKKPLRMVSATQSLFCPEYAIVVMLSTRLTAVSHIKWMYGEAHPTVLKNAGFDPEEYSGLALGMGLDRLVMIIKDIDDIRVLRSDDPRIKRQMANLDKFVKVSDQPATKRVLSYSTSTDKTEEDVCEEIRDELGLEAAYIEEIQYSEILYEQLPAKARENLGIRPDQKNVVVTIVFRSPEGSLQRAMVNEWMQRLYPKLNKGEKGYM